jgi:O-antigen/teichoic acid export membrane protein
MVTGSITIFLADVLIIPVGFITTVFLARQFGPINYGLFVLALSVVTWIEWTATSVFYGTTIKFVSEQDDWRAVGRTVLRLHLIVGCSIAVLVWLVSSPLSQAFDEPAIAIYLRLFAIDIPIFCLVCASRNILVGRGLFKERARTGSSYWIARLILIVLFVEMGLSVKGAIMGVIGASAIAFVVSRFYLKFSVFSGSTFSIRRLWGFAAPLFLSSSSVRMLTLDLAALRVLGGTAAQVGFYGAGQSLSMPINIFTQSLTSPLLSTLSRLLSQGDTVKAREIGRTAMRSIVWLLPFGAIVAGAATEIVNFVFGKEFLSAGPILALLIFAAIGFIGIGVTRAILVALGKPGWTFALTGPMVPLALVGYIILIPLLGGVGAAIVTTSTTCLATIMSFLAVYRIWGVLPSASTFVKSAFCSGLAFILAIVWPASGPVVIVKLVTVALIIFASFLLLGDFTADEMALIRTLVRRKGWSDTDGIESQ